jgi:energy-coupling factor transport system permease protein
MQLLTPLEPDPSAPLARANPVAKLAAALVLLLALFASLDGVTASLILAVLLGLVPASGLTAAVLLRRSWLILGLALSVGAFNVLFAAEQLGPTVLAIGPVRIAGDTLLNGAGVALRLVGIAMVGLLALATSQPTDVADALIQQLRVSPRFAIGALASLRLLPMLGHEWQLISMARRARGVAAGRNPIAAVGLFAGQLLSLLIGAVRRAGRMAQAMEARGFGALPERTVARVQRVRAGDWLLVAGAVVLAALAIGVSIALGTWRPLLG